MAESRSGALPVALVAIGGVMAVLLLVWFLFIRVGDGGEGADLDVDVDPGDAIENIAPE